MGLLDPIADTSTPAKRAANRIREAVRQSGRMVLQTYTVCYNDLWHNVEGATPEDINAELGADAGPCMGYATGIVGQLYPDELLDLPQGYTYAINPDGSLVLSYDPPSSSSSESESSRTSHSSHSSASSTSSDSTHEDA